MSIMNRNILTTGWSLLKCNAKTSDNGFSHQDWLDAVDMQDILRDSNHNFNNSSNLQRTVNTSNRTTTRLGTLTRNIRHQNRLRNIDNSVAHNDTNRNNRDNSIDHNHRNSFSLIYNNRIKIDLDNRLNNWNTDT